MCKVIGVGGALHPSPTCSDLVVTTVHLSSELVGSSPHTDWGWLTLILQQEDVTGLQIALEDGTWADVTPVPGALTVNIGRFSSYSQHY